MPTKVILSSRDVTVRAVLDDTPAAAAVAAKLPIEGLAQTRGAEVFFFVDFTVEENDPTEEAPPGTIAYWPAGSAICVFYGSKPMTPVEVIGKLEDDPGLWRKVVSGDSILMKKA